MNQQPDKTATLPKVGDYLFASCLGEDYGRILTVGHDSNGVQTIDIELLQPNEILSFENTDENGGSGYGNYALTRLEVPPNTVLILRDVQWKDLGDGMIECNTPGNGCYRCTKLFKLHASLLEAGGWNEIQSAATIAIRTFSRN